MEPIRSDSQQELDKIRQDINRLLDSLQTSIGEGSYTLRSDIQETGQEVVITADIPGLNSKDDLEVGVTDDSITIKGELRRSQEVQKANLIQAERFFGRFSRTMALPARVNPEKAQATYLNGVLEINLPKVEASDRTSIQLPTQ